MSILRQLSWFFRLKWQRYAIACATLLIISALVMVPPWITGNIVNAIADQRLTFDELLINCAIIAMLAIVVYVLRYIWRIALYGASYQLAALLHQRIYHHLTRMPPAFFQRYKTGDLMARATSDVGAVEMTAGEGILAMVDGVFTGVIVLVIMTVALSWKLTLLALLPWPIMVVMMGRYGIELQAAVSEAQRQFGRLNDYTQESLAGMRLIKAFGRQEKTLTSYTEVVRQTTDANYRVAKVDAKYEPTIFVTIALSFLLAVAGGGWWIKQGEFTVGELTTFTIYLGYLIWPMFAFGWVLNILKRGTAAYQRIDQLLSTQPDINDDGKENAPAQAAIDIAVSRYAYPNTHHDALRNIHVSLLPGQTLGIVGPTGAGKSTLLDLLLRLNEAPGAEIRLDGKPLHTYRLQSLREHIGLVPQDPFLFSSTVSENIALGRPDAELDTIRAAARLACVDEDIMALPVGYNTMVGERGVTLSGGQKQRIAIARALLLNPPVLVLDDTLSAVDVRTESHILRHLRHDRAGHTNIIACHRLSAVVDADHIIVLQHGEITEQGRHEQLIAQNGWYAQMFRYQQIERSLED